MQKEKERHDEDEGDGRNEGRRMRRTRRWFRRIGRSRSSMSDETRENDERKERKTTGIRRESKREPRRVYESRFQEKTTREKKMRRGDRLTDSFFPSITTGYPLPSLSFL